MRAEGITMADKILELIKKIRKIQIRTTQIADTLLAGAWHSAFKGRGMQFEEVRSYQPGDEIRDIDWNVTARMNHPYVKVYKEERELTVILLVDISASCQFGSSDRLKKELIAEISSVLAFAAIKNNDNVGLILFSEEVEKYIPPKKGSRHVLRVIRELVAYESLKKKTDLLKALDFMGGIFRKASICFLISDFICPLHEKKMSVLAQKHDLIAIRVLDPYELKFPKMELIHLFDLETGHRQMIDTSNKKVIANFEQNAKKRHDFPKVLLEKMGAGLIDIRTNEPYLPAMTRFFKAREIKH